MKFIDEMIALAMPAIESQNCELVDAEYKKEGTQMILRFYIELKEGRVSLDECAAVSELISKEIDARDDIRDNFILEVSSPGVERVLKKPSDYVRFSGEKVDVALYKAYEGEKKFTCVLKGYDDGNILFEKDGKDFALRESEVSKMNLHFDFNF